MDDNSTTPGEDLPKPLADLLEPGATLMVGTQVSDVVRFRPLTVARAEGDRIDILVDTRTEWARALTDDAPAWVTLSDNRENKWISLSGTCALDDDPALIDELWSPFAGAYFDDGRETPGIAVLSVDCEVGVYWSTPSGRIGTLISMVSAALGDSNDSGERGAVRL